MLSRTIFIFHHYDPICFDSGALEALMWERIFKVMPYCHTVVCVSPYWLNYLSQKGIWAELVYNSFDIELINSINQLERAVLKEKFNLPKDKINVYLGQAVKLKGIEAIHSLLHQYQDLNLITTGKNKLDLSIKNYFLPSYRDYLKFIRSCDVGIFNSEIKEGWTCCAAETILLQVPCLIKPIAGLGDLASMARQPTLNLDNSQKLHDAIVERAKCTREETLAAYQVLSIFNKPYFNSKWSALLENLIGVEISAPPDKAVEKVA